MNKPESCEIQVSRHGVAFIGHDAVELFMVVTLMAHIRLYAKTGIIPTRGLTITDMLKKATSITRKPYKRNQGGYSAALTDLEIWKCAMSAALPIEIKD